MQESFEVILNRALQEAGLIKPDEKVAEAEEPAKAAERLQLDPGSTQQFLETHARIRQMFAQGTPAQANKAYQPPKDPPPPTVDERA